MKSREEILKEIKIIEDDPRFSYPDANVEINAPLALIQMGMKTRRDTLKWVLE
jgi:hypothetical protein